MTWAIINSHALIKHLGTLVPHLDDRLKIALVQGAVQPLRLFLGALVPTLIAAAAFRLI